jgi:hypothetical protein
MNAPSSSSPVSAILAPVVVFAYMRPQHLRRTVESLLRNPEAAATHVTVYCDAAKRPEHRAGVEAVRAYVESLSGFASVTRVYRIENLGLARSVIAGVTQALSRDERVIVVEDDLLLSPHFLRYMNDGLERYRDDKRVASIHGYSYPTESPLPETFFLRGADCWGWATWRRAWEHFEPDGRALISAIRQRGLAREIDYDGNYPHMRILKHQIAGKNDSWAIRWHASCYLDDMLTLYPGCSLVVNIGHDDSGSHCRDDDSFTGELAHAPIAVQRVPIAPSEPARAAVVEFFRARRKTLFRKIKERLGQRITRTIHPTVAPK